MQTSRGDGYEWHTNLSYQVSLYTANTTNPKNLPIIMIGGESFENGEGGIHAAASPTCAN